MFKSSLQHWLVIGAIIVSSLSLLASRHAQSATSFEHASEDIYALENIGLRIDARISTLKLIAQTVANDAHVHAWIDSGLSSPEAPVLVEKLTFLVEKYGLTSASFADTKTHRYWNHEGFLRELNPKVDTWYFSYLASKEVQLANVYHDKNKNRIDLYVNFRQINGNGLSGVATSIESVIDLLSAPVLSSQSQVFIVDDTGKIQIHANEDSANYKHLNEVVPPSAFNTLLKPNTTHFLFIDKRKQTKVGVSHIPSINWYVVAITNTDTDLK